MPNKFDIEPDYCPEEFLEIARKELRETPEVREEATKKLKELLLEAKDLYYGTDDDFLIIFLRPCKWYPESALKLMRAVAEFRKQYQDLVYNLAVDNLKAQFTENQVVNIMPTRDHKGRRVMIVNSGQLWDPKRVTEEEMFQLFYIIHLLAQLEPVTQIAGVVVIMDFEGLGLKQAKSITPGGSKRLLTFIQKAMPLRLKEVHFVKQPMIFKMVWALLKPFVEEKLNKRMFFHGNDMKKLHEHIDPAYLPANYGGKLPAIDYSGKDWYACVDNYKDHIERWSHYGFTELKDKK